MYARLARKRNALCFLSNGNAEFKVNERDKTMGPRDCTAGRAFVARLVFSIS